MAPPRSLAHGLTGPQGSLCGTVQPSPRQRDAIRRLNSVQHPSQTLEGLQTIRRGLAEGQRRTHTDYPTGPILAALLTLALTNPDDIVEWLQQDQQGQEEGFSNASYIFPRTASAEADDKKYRCSTGEHLPKARSDNVRSFKRHELEHVDRFYCVSIHTDLRSLENALTCENTCKFCGKRNPDLSHLVTVHLKTCLEREEPFCFTRRDTFAKHLKTIHNADLHNFKELPSSSPWYCQLQKSVFTCGICIGVLFDSKKKQINHIAECHCKSMADWSETRMMRNLLRHPQVSPAWNSILASNKSIAERYLSWPQNIAHRVPLEFDFSSKTAEDLASAAFKYRIENDSIIHEDDTRIPIQLTSGGTKESLPSPNQGLHWKSPSLPIVNPEDDRLKSFLNSSALADLDSRDENDGIDGAVMGSSIALQGNLEPHRSNFKRPPFDDLDPYSTYTPYSETNGSSDYMPTLGAPPDTFSASQVSTATNPELSFGHVNNSTSEFNQWDTGSDFPPDNAYAPYPPNGSFAQNPNQWGGPNIVHQTYAQPQQQPPGWTTPSGEEGIQIPGYSAPTSAPGKSM